MKEGSDRRTSPKKRHPRYLHSTLRIQPPMMDADVQPKITYWKPSEEKGRRRKVELGFPVEEPFESREEAIEYISGDKIVCLRCGRELKALVSHLLAIHEMTAHEYRKLYQIPSRFGLSCAPTRTKKSTALKERLVTGVQKYAHEYPEYLTRKLVGPVGHKRTSYERDAMAARTRGQKHGPATPERREKIRQAAVKRFSKKSERNRNKKYAALGRLSSAASYAVLRWLHAFTGGCRHSWKTTYAEDKKQAVGTKKRCSKCHAYCVRLSDSWGEWIEDPDWKRTVNEKLPNGQWKPRAKE